MSDADVLQRVWEFADRNSVEAAPDYKDEWERGFDAGSRSLAIELQKILRRYS